MLSIIIITTCILTLLSLIHCADIALSGHLLREQLDALDKLNADQGSDHNV